MLWMTPKAPALPSHPVLLAACFTPLPGPCGSLSTDPGSNLAAEKHKAPFLEGLPFDCGRPGIAPQP